MKEIKELKEKGNECFLICVVNNYKSKVKVANEKIISLGTKIAHIELEYKQ